MIKIWTIWKTKCSHFKFSKKSCSTLEIMKSIDQEEEVSILDSDLSYAPRPFQIDDPITNFVEQTDRKKDKRSLQNVDKVDKVVQQPIRQKNSASKNNNIPYIAQILFLFILPNLIIGNKFYYGLERYRGSVAIIVLGTFLFGVGLFISLILLTEGLFFSPSIALVAAMGSLIAGNILANIFEFTGYQLFCGAVHHPKRTTGVVGLSLFVSGVLSMMLLLGLSTILTFTWPFAFSIVSSCFITTLFCATLITEKTRFLAADDVKIENRDKAEDNLLSDKEEDENKEHIEQQENEELLLASSSNERAVNISNNMMATYRILPQTALNTHQEGEDHDIVHDDDPHQDVDYFEPTLWVCL